jgi:hypothetical protein
MPTPYLPPWMHTANMRMLDRPVLRDESRPVPFITITWQPGAERDSLPGELARKLTDAEPRAPAWSHWDVELIQKVSASCHIPAAAIVALEQSGYSWLEDLLTGISGRTDQLVVFHRIRDEVRELARSGHAVLVGHGSVYMTRDLPGGLHVRLIAPLELRISNTAKRLNIPVEQAERLVRRLDRERQAFFHRFWPDRALDMEMFAAMLNIAELDDQRLTDCVMTMLPSRGHPRGA